MDFAEAKPLQLKCQLQKLMLHFRITTTFYSKNKDLMCIMTSSTTNMARKKTKELDDSSSLKSILHLAFSSPYISLL
jgi:hypothetical protein